LNRHDRPEALPGLNERPEAPVFDEPWQAQLFALTVHLNERGLFSWSEWAAHFSKALGEAKTNGAGSGYYACWLDALEDILSRKSVADRAQIEQIAASWRRAAEATPHGSPIALDHDPAGRPGKSA